MLSKYYPGGYFGYDRDGSPVFIDPIGQIDFKGMILGYRAQIRGDRRVESLREAKNRKERKKEDSQGGGSREKLEFFLQHDIIKHKETGTTEGAGTGRTKYGRWEVQTPVSHGCARLSILILY